MAFKNFKTYGRYKNRVIKTDLWITPKKALYSSSESDQSATSTNASGNNARGLQNFDISSSASTSREMLPNGADLSHFQNTSTPSTTHTPSYHLPVDVSNERLSSLSSMSSNCKNHNLAHLHSTPLSRKQSNTTEKDVSEISPLSLKRSQYNNIHNNQEHFSSPVLFSDTSYVSNLCSQSSFSDHESRLQPNSGSNEGMVNLNIVDITNNRPVSQIPNDVTEMSISDRSRSMSTDIKTISNKMKELCLLDAQVHLDACEGLHLLKRNNLDDDHKEILEESDSSNNSTPEQSQLYKGNIEVRHEYSFVEALTPQHFDVKKKFGGKQKILIHCEQQNDFKFTDVFTGCMMEKCVKVGEGTYGEVYKTNNGDEDVALKVIPVEGNFPVNDEPQKSFDEMIPEIVIAKELSNLNKTDVLEIEPKLNVCPNFIKVKRVMLVQDSYPQMLLYEWDKWKSNHKCENDRPDIFPADQYFIVFEFIDGGDDLEHFEFGNVEEALSVIQQIVLSLSVSELSLKFEHRDLHWGNILIKRPSWETLHYKLNGRDVSIDSCGVFVSIIDFTLSRLTKDGVTVFCDLSKDPDLFNGKGDYQFQVYRLMRKANEDDWEAHVPYSNVLWIRYLIDKILNVKKYKVKNNHLHRNIRTILRRILSYHSAVDTQYDNVLGLYTNN